MNKIFSMLCLGVIGLLYGVVLGVTWLIGMIFLLVNEILGTKKFRKKFKGLNQIIAEEFKDNLNSFKSIFELV